MNSLVLDPSYPNTIYAGTDVGPFVTYDGGAHWGTMGTGFPRVGDRPARPGPVAPHDGGGHPRSQRVHDERRHRDAGAGALEGRRPTSRSGRRAPLKYTITLRNIGNAAATGVKLTDPLPADTSFAVGQRRRHRLGRDRHVERAQRARGRDQADHADGDDRRGAEEEGRLDHQRRLPGHLGPGPGRQRLAGDHPDRAGPRGDAGAGDADRRRPRRARASPTR